MSHPPTFAVAISAFLFLAIVAEAFHSAHSPSPLINTASSRHLSQHHASFE